VRGTAQERPALQPSRRPAAVRLLAIPRREEVAVATKKKRGGRRYGKKASDKVHKAMHERKRGTLKSGSGKKVTSRKQAIAIGLSQARKAGGKVPSKSSGGGRKKSTGGRKKTAAKRSHHKGGAKRSHHKKRAA
jgi:hypothetical protein